MGNVNDKSTGRSSRQSASAFIDGPSDDGAHVVKAKQCGCINLILMSGLFAMLLAGPIIVPVGRGLQVFLDSYSFLPVLAASGLVVMTLVAIARSKYGH